jgi:peptide/nickel transport system permease protein
MARTLPVEDEIAYDQGTRVASVKAFTKLLLKSWKGRLGIAIILAFVVLAISPQVFAPYSPTIPSGLNYESPSSQHLLGTDHIGVDVLSEVLWGARVSLVIGLAAAAFSTGIGSVIGIVAGYKGKYIDEILMRASDISLSIPSLVLMILFVVYLGPSLYSILFSISITTWPPIARSVRSLVLSLRERPFVDAARLTGMGDARIMAAVILPNVLALIVANGILQVTASIVAEAALDFIGLGVPSLVSWGTMLYWAQVSGAFLYGAWWVIATPGICIALLGFGFVLLGFALEEVGNPRIRQ